MKLSEYYNLENLQRTSEQIVLERVGRMLDERTDICTCEECVLDLVAYVLNNVSPYYGTSLVGSLDSGQQRIRRLRGEVEVALREAVRRVGRNPNHDK